MYFEILYWLGVSGASLAMAANRDWLLLGWAALMTIFGTVQRGAPKHYSDEEVRLLFCTCTVVQCTLCILLAGVTQSVGACLIAAGSTSNMLVVAANGCRMPFLNAHSTDPRYTQADKYTRLMWLCDLFPTTKTSWSHWLISPGDALEVIGLWVFTAELLLARL